ncbi:MAG: glycoside hydrolase 43 family protein [Prevotella sp.]|nr:glycoside hydrolase 43 family protein [Prevotella sp.]
MLRRMILAFIVSWPMLGAAQYRSQVWCPDNGDGTYTNPVINADYSDPDVIAVGDDYYLTASSFNCTPGLPVLHSKDLVNWEIIGHAVRRLTPDSLFSGAPAHGNGVWAPAIRYHNGEYYIYWGDPDNGVFMVKAKNPAGPWDEPVLVIKGKGMIDTCPLWDDDGRCYLVNGWANSRNRFASVITVRELSADGTRAIGDPTIVFDGNGTEYRTCEGPKFYKRDGWYWVMFPAGGVPTGFQVAMRSRSPFGPYEAKKVLAQGHTNINGPHQGGWVHTAQGEDWFMHFQDKGAYGRVVHLQPVTWKDNWPVMGRVPKSGYCGEPYTTYRKPKSSSMTIVNPQESDEFDAPTLGQQWQWHANYDQSFGMPTSLGCFRLYTWKSNRPIWHTPNLLLQKTPADNFTATTKFKFVAKAENQYGGIIMMGLDYSALVVKRVGDHFELQQITCKNADKGGAETVTTLARLDKTGQDENDYQFAIHEEIYLRMQVAAGQVTFSYSHDGQKFKPAGSPFTMREGKWIGAKIGLVAQEPAGTTNRGWIDADWFRVGK